MSLVKQNRVSSFFVGQSISVAIACTSVFTQFLANKNVYLAFTQNFGNYFILSFFMFHRLMKKESKLHIAWWKYMIVAFIDAEANFLIVKAFEYTTILSVMLCDAMCIPAVVFLSLFFLHSKFHWRHYLAVFLCIFGLAIMIAYDWNKSSSEGTHRVLGDMMALSAAVMYAISNICQESLVKHDDWKEFLGMIGIGGSLVSITQIILFERSILTSVTWDWMILLLLLGYVVCLSGMYILTAVFLKKNDAVILNMHLLTSDVLAAVFSFFAFDDVCYSPTLIYFIALAITVIGVVIYNREPPVNDLSIRTLPIKAEVTIEIKKPINDNKEQKE